MHPAHNMKYTLFIFLLIPLFASAQIDTILSSNIQRTYKIQLPDNYDLKKRYPLLLVFHGYHYENLGMPEYTGFDKFTNKHCIVAYPHGLKEENGINYFWNSGGGLSVNYGGVDDVKFIDNLIDTLTCNYSIYTDSVFITGHSNGGMMVYRLALELSHKITAMANVSGSMMFDSIVPEYPLPVLHIHGTSDPIVPTAGYSGPIWPSMNVDSVLYQWAAWNHCNPKPDTIANTATYLYVQWTDKTGKKMVLGSFIKNQGHDWAAITNSGWNVAENIWYFFTRREFYNFPE
jgi:polyhydroxybutyrate depolymerase